MGEFQETLKKIRNMPLKVVAKKVITKSYNNTYHKAREIYIKINPIETNGSLFQDFMPEAVFLLNPNEKESYIEKLKELNLIKQIIDDADMICKHKFDLLGSGITDLGESIPWNKDFKVDFTWPNDYYKKIRIIDFRNSADVKVPWELSRFQHLFTLGKAYWITNDEKYANEFKNQVEDWLCENPVEMSVNWTSTMDVAIRAVNWITAYFFFKDSISIKKSFWISFYKSLYLHGSFIMKNLENKYNHTGNHYLSNIVGLVWISIFFKNLSFENKKGTPHITWFEFGIIELNKEIFVQNNQDGTNYEASTSYHRLVTELFLLTTIVCQRNNIVFPENYMNRLEKMCEFVQDITKPNGLSPIIGDADDGRLLILSNYSRWEKNDFRHLLGIAGNLFNREDFLYYGQSHKEDTLWFYNNNYSIDNYELKHLTSTAYKEGGYYILRNNRIYCCVRCGELSFRGEGIHSHNDQLSIELNIDGEDFIIDPGTYVYTADYKHRNLFRSTIMHSTVQIENYEQNDFEPKSIFSLKEQTKANSQTFTDQYFEGTHIGFLNNCNTVHKREIFLEEETVNIIDNLIGDQKIHNSQAFLILAPGVECFLDHNKVLLKKNNVNVECIFSREVEIKDCFISASYGKITESKKIIIPFVKENIIKIEIC